MKWLKRHYKKLIISVLGLSLVLFLIIRIPMDKINYEAMKTQPFDPSGFTDASTLSNKNKKVAENADFQLYIDETTSYFSVVNKKNGYVWRSNPNIDDPKNGVNPTPAAIEKQLSTLEVSYFNQSGSVASMNNYGKSIYHPEGVLNEKGERTYSIKYLDDAVQILYSLVDLEITHLYFPKYLSEVQINDEIFTSRQIQQLKYIYKNSEDVDLNEDGVITDDEKFYVIPNYDNSLSLLNREALYELLYEIAGYTLEDVQEINEKFDIFDESVKIEFEVAVQVKLTDSGVETKILKESIVERGAKISEISLYPMFGTAVSIENGQQTSGYMVLPDGSGAAIQLNNGKTSQNAYRKRLYGQDIANLPYKMAEQQQKASIPLFGLVKEENGFAAIITEADAMAFINADISGRIDSYNRIYASFRLRENELVTLGTGYNQFGVNMWTKDIVSTDFAIQYSFLVGETNNYVGVANVYRNYLINNLGMTEKDNTTETVLTTELLGAFDQKSFFLGVPYKTLGSLTTFDQAQIIIEELRNKGINEMNVSYLGVANGGLSNLLYDRNDIPKVLGGAESYNELINYLADLDINLYQSANFVSALGYRGFTDSFKYNSKRVSGKQSILFDYNYPSRLTESEFSDEDNKDQYVLNPLYYQAVYDKYHEVALANGLSLEYIGSELSGSYEYESTIYKQDTLNIQKQLLESMEELIALSDPLGFAMPYASVINDLPTETTLYALIDFQIPVLQLVLSGLVDYSTTSLNFTSDRSSRYQFLKVLETGSNLKYTLSYEDSLRLLNTDHNEYMSTHYVNWVDVIADQVKEINDLKIHEGRIVNHEMLANNLYQVTYSNGLVLLINYNQNRMTHTRVNEFNQTQNYTIDGLDYIVLKEGN